VPLVKHKQGTGRKKHREYAKPHDY
jgi:hypothetical protein